MVKGFLNIFNREVAGLHQAAYLLGFFAFCSQILALFRDRILASQFGAGNTLDLYYSAFRIPDILFVTVASIVSISVLIPFLIERLEKDENSAKDFLDNIFSFFFLFMVVCGVIAYFMAPYIMAVLFPVFATSDSFPELIQLTRILLLSPVLLGFSNLLASITQIHRRFFIYAISPVVYNIGIIFGIVFLYPVFGLSGLGFGVVIGAFLHLLIQVPFIVSQGMLPKFRFPVNFGLIKKVILISIPRTITVSSNELAKLFLISYAALFVTGSVSIFNFSLNLQNVPFSIIGMSYSLAAFPTLTKLFTSGKHKEFIEQMIISSRHIIFWSVPVTVMFVVLRAQIVRTILGAGNFNWDDTRLTAAALAIFTISLVAQNLTNIFVRSFYSRGKTKLPLVMNVVATVCIVGFSYLLVQVFQESVIFRDFIESLFKVSGVPGTVILMLPLGFTLGIIVNLITHWVSFAREFPSYSAPVSKTLFQIGGASLIMGYVSYHSLYLFSTIFNTATLLGIFMQGLVSGVCGIVVGVLVLYLLNNMELKEVWGTLHKKIWRAKVIVPDAELQ
ncbi:MAG: hypothetical protein A2566_03330 [Candidatus Zambryskibacteria bacterium RIFOXYD1_FULL_40_13]|nr:MAG: Integral membrane protein MviN [Parcubacteria group bacterium GW2011_GWC1_39_12]KKR19479.1 MAG: Integral membrane protein MviN [Parcubacteria group bacterium GW2011_GWF1_39_37]KKR35105.1 MAG: Integral membrane protein MviN [Parcubacteria group bacterium GW2011_GWC2_40_10]KKR52428.1 MAG: Integral membrane protein MviN [Parcubacteria group bacterium GW2011_GWE1_40_20]KKR65885.1 MAG: Integral membrane protein MviN [Parcubacteria group bacterium GW2011_GWB1_40_5]KKR69492.1 MAG: Integral me